ncbi:Glycosyltransferase [Quillaja saponaria]|uniref:Glycosyltransferase n=1 Tax=Quillaja saponaria TaxID=32244 RepID=A0AAD7KQE1_QUISA|nr:Glycosyltransferase [Quillaja saponaria]WEU75099.1 UGT73CU3 [Quillaja saponaria]
MVESPADHDVLKIIVLPWVTSGHMIPMVDAARLFAMHGADVTIITTPANALTFQKSVDRDFNSGRLIRTHTLKFPAAEVGVPEGVENFNNTSPEMTSKVYLGVSMLREPTQQLIEDLRPDCLITDMFYPWAVDVADKLGIPRLIFQGPGSFGLSAMHSIKQYEPFKSVTSDTETFPLPGLPHKVEMTRLQIPKWVREPNGYTQLMGRVKDSERRSYGSLVNSFYDFEGPYEEHYRKATGQRVWSIGPVSVWVNQDAADKVGRGQDLVAEDQNSWLNWLNSKEKNSVLYVSFGSMAKFPSAQLLEIAHGLEASGHSFIWVVRKVDGDDDVDVWLPDFEKKMKENNKGFIIRNWAPQLLILDHPAIGGLLNHSGWNSVLEGATAGLPMITWPLYAEHFYNERLVLDVLKIGVPVGVKEWKNLHEVGELVRRDAIAKAIKLLMGSGEEAEVMRKKAKELGVGAKKGYSGWRFFSYQFDSSD